MANLLFILGCAGSGKTSLAKKFIRKKIEKRDPWVLLDKDTCGKTLAAALMKQMGLNPLDRDSPAYKESIRDLEYQTCLDLIKENLSLGVNVVAPGPWTKEINSGKIFSVKDLDLPGDTKIHYVYIEGNPKKIKNIIEKRARPQDTWKLENWDKFEKSLVTPENIANKNIHVFKDGTDVFEQVKFLLNEMKL